MFQIKHIGTGEIISCNGENGAIEHNNNDLILGFDGKVYRYESGDGFCVYLHDMSEEYKLIIANAK